MDPQTDLPDLVEDLEVNIDELSTVLAPLLTGPLSTTASSLPLLDKAKLNILAAYSIESLLYSSLQASGVNAKEHAIFRELARLKGYFGKIKEVEERAAAPAAPRPKVDVGAVGRFIRHGLSGNDKYDLERAERMAKEKARVQLKASRMHKRFDEEGEETKDASKKRPVEEMAAEEEVENEVLGGLEESKIDEQTEPAKKKTRLSGAAGAMDIDSAPSPTTSTLGADKTRQDKSKKKSRSAVTSEAETPEDMQADIQFAVEEPALEPAQTITKKKKNKPTETSAVEIGDNFHDDASPSSEQQDTGADLSAEPKRRKKDKVRGKKKSKSAQTPDTEAPAADDQVEMEIYDVPESPVEPDQHQSRKGKRPKRKNSNTTTSEVEVQDAAPEAEPEPSARKKRKQRGLKGKLSSGITEEDDAEGETILPIHVPKTRSETFNALLDGSLPEKVKKSKNKAKEKGKGK